MNSPHPARQIIEAADTTNPLLEHKLKISFINSCTDTNPAGEELTIGEIVERFSTPQTNPKGLPLAAYLALDKKITAQKIRRDAEKNGEAFIPVKFKRSGTRAAVDVEMLYAYVLDFDGTADIDTIKAGLGDLCYIAYTSYSHSLKEERWRVIIFYNEPIGPELHLNVWQHFEAIFPNMLDQRSKTFNQLWYCPACPHDAVDLFRFEFHEGELLDPTTLPAYVEVPADKTKGTASTKDFGNEIAALKYIDPEDRDIWIRVAMALKSEYGDDGREVWLEWSQRSDKYDEVDARYQWDSLKPRPDGITIGTIYYLARQGGWIPTDCNLVNIAGIEELNADHFVSRENGKTCVFREKHDDVMGRQYLERMSTKDVFDFYYNRKISITTNKKIKLTDLGNYWLGHPNRRQYEDVIFRPNRETPGSYNLWRGYAVEPKQGDWQKMKYHIKEVLCKGDEALYCYVLGWTAYAIQYPDRPGEVALVMQGGRGAGKGTYAHMVGRLFGQHYLQVTQGKHLVGNFNAHLRDCVFLFADEALWAGDRNGENVLKALVTEPTIVIEPKGFNSFRVPNYLHIAIASNNDWVVPAGEHERRYCVLQVSDKHAQDIQYFAALRTEMENGGLAAMLYDLLNMDLSKFNVRTVPFTAGLKEQMLHSLPVEKRWWYEELLSGSIWNEPVQGISSSIKPPNSIKRDSLQQRFTDACQGLHVSRGSSTALGMLLPKLLPDGWPKDFRPKESVSAMASRYYILPPLDEARKHFEHVSGLVGAFDGEGVDVVKSNLTNLSNLSGKLRKVK